MIVKVWHSWRKSPLLMLCLRFEKIAYFGIMVMVRGDVTTSESVDRWISSSTVMSNSLQDLWSSYDFDEIVNGIGGLDLTEFGEFMFWDLGISVTMETVLWFMGDYEYGCSVGMIYALGIECRGWFSNVLKCWSSRMRQLWLRLVLLVWTEGGLFDECNLRIKGNYHFDCYVLTALWIHCPWVLGNLIVRNGKYCK